MGVSRTVESEAFAQCLEGGGILGGSQIEVAPEQQGQIPGPLGRRPGGAQDVGRCQLRPVVGRVQIGDAELRPCADRDAGERHRPPLRSPAVDLQLPPLHDLPAPVRLLLLRDA
jgi:hypothetical protein